MKYCLNFFCTFKNEILGLKELKEKEFKLLISILSIYILLLTILGFNYIGGRLRLLFA